MQWRGKKKKNNLVSSELGTSLIERWAWGTMSPQEVQDLALRSKHDFEKAGAVPPEDIAFLASMGTSGAHKPLGLQELFCIYFTQHAVMFYYYYLFLCHKSPAKAKYAQGFVELCQQSLFAAKSLHAKYYFQATLQQACANDAFATFGFQPDIPLLQECLGHNHLPKPGPAQNILETAGEASCIPRTSSLGKQPSVFYQDGATGFAW